MEACKPVLWFECIGTIATPFLVGISVGESVVSSWPHYSYLPLPVGIYTYIYHRLSGRTHEGISPVSPHTSSPHRYPKTCQVVISYMNIFFVCPWQDGCHQWCRYPQVPWIAVTNGAGTPQVPCMPVTNGAEIGLLSLGLSASQGASLGDFLLALTRAP